MSVYVCIYVCIYVCMYICMYVCMDGWMDGWMYVCTYIGTSKMTTVFFAVPLRGLLSLVRTTLILERFEHMFVIFWMVLWSVLIKVHSTKQSLALKILKMHLYEGQKNII